MSDSLPEITREDALVSLGLAHLEIARLTEANNGLCAQLQDAVTSKLELERQLEHVRYTPQFFVDQLLDDLKSGRVPLPTAAFTLQGVPSISASVGSVSMVQRRIIVPVEFTWQNHACTVDFAYQLGLRGNCHQYAGYQGISWEKPAAEKVRKRAPAKTAVTKQS